MVFIIDETGTTQLVQTSPIYQGSTGVNDIILFAPFPANYRILISCILPNGLPLRDVYPMEAIVMPTILQSINKQRYTCFRATVGEMLTGIAGNVEIQFRVIQGVSIVSGKPKPNILATYKSAFNVGEGVPIDPEYTPTENDSIETLLGYLESLSGDYLKRIYYSAPSSNLINNRFNQNSSVSITPEGFNDYSTDFSPFNPEAMNQEGDKTFLALNDNPGNAGFIVDIGSIVNIAVLQMYVYSDITDIIATISTSEDGVTYGQPTSLLINATVQPESVVVRSYINSESVRYLKVTFNSDISIQKVQLFSPTYYGQYIFEFSSGAKSVVNFSELVEVLRSEIFQALASISQEASTAKETADNAFSLATTAYDEAINAKTTAETALTNSQTALTNSQTALNGVPKTRFDKSFPLLVLQCMTDPTVKPGDLMINIAETQIDFLVFSADPPAFPISGYEVLTYQDAVNTVDYENPEYESLPKLPTPEVGAIYLIENVNPSTGANIGSPRIGIIALEGGFSSPGYAVDDAFSKTSERPVQNRVITAALGDVEAVLDNIISLQNSYINGGVPNGN